MRLRPFPAELAATVAAWATAPEEVVMWCGHAGGPVTAEQVTAWAAEEGVQAFGLFADDRLVGYGEVWLDEEEAEAELARLIVDPGHRGRGIGRRLVTELAARAVRAYPDVFLRVHPDNEAALRCYAGAGFRRVDPAQAAEWNVAQPVGYVWLARPGAASGDPHAEPDHADDGIRW